MKPSIIYIVFILFSLVCCKNFKANKRVVASDDTLVAKVSNKALYYSDIEDMISATSPSDSLAQLNGIVQSWLKQNVMLTEAENNFPEDVDMDKLVEDYRASLLIYNYKQSLVKTKLDTMITAEQEKEYYDEHNSQYLLSSPICMAKIVIIPEDSERIDRFYSQWKRKETQTTDNYILENANFSMLDDTVWKSVDLLLSFLPAEKFSEKDLKSKGTVQKNYNGNEYFLKIVDRQKEKSIAPQAYISDKIKKVIIHKRKNEIIDGIEQKLYNDFLKANKIKVYTK